MDRMARAACLLFLGGIACAGRADAGPLDPTKFNSLGTLSLSSGDFYTIDSTAGVLTLGNGGTTYTGVLSNGVAVFDFDSIDIASGASLFANQGAGLLPIALLSRTT